MRSPGGPRRASPESRPPPAAIRRKRERSWSGCGSGRHGFRGRRCRGRFLLDDIVPALVANRKNVDDATRRIARKGAVERAVMLLRHLIDWKTQLQLFHSWTDSICSV